MNPEPSTATLFESAPKAAISGPAPSGMTVNPSVPAADVARLTAQARVIFQRLRAGSVTTGELSDLAAQYNARIKEIRDWLRDFGWTVDKISSKTQANNTYALRPFMGSKYQAMLMKKSARAKTAVRSQKFPAPGRAETTTNQDE